MNREIAVIQNYDGETTSLFEPGQVVVYQSGCQNQNWQPVRHLDFRLKPVENVAELRRQMAFLFQFLDQCRVLVARSVTGVPYLELDKRQFSVWEVAGCPQTILDDIMAAEETADADDPDLRREPPRPQEIMPGAYQISLKEIQKNNQIWSSKQILLPFLEQMNFKSLEIICDHIPPWLSLKFSLRELSGMISRCGPNDIRIVINKRS